MLGLTASFTAMCTCGVLVTVLLTFTTIYSSSSRTLHAATLRVAQEAAALTAECYVEPELQRWRRVAQTTRLLSSAFPKREGRSFLWWAQLALRGLATTSEHFFAEVNVTKAGSCQIASSPLETCCTVPVGLPASQRCPDSGLIGNVSGVDAALLGSRVEENCLSLRDDLAHPRFPSTYQFSVAGLMAVVYCDALTKTKSMCDRFVLPSSQLLSAAAPSPLFQQRDHVVLGDTRAFIFLDGTDIVLASLPNAANRRLRSALRPGQTIGMLLLHGASTEKVTGPDEVGTVLRLHLGDSCSNQSLLIAASVPLVHVESGGSFVVCVAWLVIIVLVFSATSSAATVTYFRGIYQGMQRTIESATQHDPDQPPARTTAGDDDRFSNGDRSNDDDDTLPCIPMESVADVRQQKSFVPTLPTHADSSVQWFDPRSVVPGSFNSMVVVCIRLNHQNSRRHIQSVVALINRYGGQLLSLKGDHILTGFGGGLYVDHPDVRGCAAACMLMQRFKDPPVEDILRAHTTSLSIGISTGFVNILSMVVHSKTSYRIIEGAAASTAVKLAHPHSPSSRILASGDTIEKCHDFFVTRRLPSLGGVGAAYEILGAHSEPTISYLETPLTHALPDGCIPVMSMMQELGSECCVSLDTLASVATFHRALQHFDDSQFLEALQLLETESADALDTPTVSLREECIRKCKKRPPIGPR